MIYEPLRRPFAIRLSCGRYHRIVAVERHGAVTFLINEDGGAINHVLFLQMIKRGEAVFEITQHNRTNDEYESVAVLVTEE